MAWRDCTPAEVKRQQSPIDLGQYDVSCGSTRVPRDWLKPTGATYDIALIRARSKNLNGRLGSLLYNPGGPGAPGVDRLGIMLRQLSPTITSRFDIVGFDPRGVGGSAPVKCFPDALKDRVFAATSQPANQAEFDQQVNLQRQIGASCQRMYGADLGTFSTEQTARDLDAIRAALGDPKLTYVGSSYGTQLGAVYAHLFGDRVRAFVLDGAVDPTLSSTANAQGQAAGFEQAFARFAMYCRQNAAACRLGADPAATVKQLLARLKVRPLSAADGRVLTDGLAQLGIMQSLYAKEMWPELVKAVADASAGQPEGLLALADSYAGRRPDGTYTNQMDANTVINCADDGRRPTVAQVRQLYPSWRTTYPLMGAALAMTMLSCVGWPAKPDPAPIGRATGAPPILVVGTVGDPATPYRNTAKLAQLLGTGTVLTWQGDGHTAYGKSACVNERVDRYLTTVDPPANGVTCSP